MILVSDIGTTVLKAGLLNTKGELCKYSSQVIANNGISVDSSLWLKAFSSICEELDTKNADIQCIIISGNGPTLAPSQQGKALLWTHKAPLEAQFIFEKTGLQIPQTMFLPKALFIKNNYPELYRSNNYFFSSPEYLSFILTGVAKTFMSLEGLEKFYWTDEILKALELDATKFPPFIKTGEYLGCVQSSAAANFKIKQGTPVLAGCPDFVASIIGSGAMHAKQICNRSGTGEGINYCAVKREENPSYMCYRHPNLINWNISTVIEQSGRLIDLAKGDKISYSDFFRTQQCQKICMDICNKLKNAIKEVSNGEVSEVRITGGPSKSDLFNQMRSDICQVKFVTVQSPEAGLSGLGVIALSALEKQDITSVADRVVKVKKVYYPR